MQNKDSVHVWKFFKAGGAEQVELESSEDLRALGSLDKKLWAALSCPVTGLFFDSKTLEILDADSDGKIRAPEVVSAVEWLCANMKNPEAIFSDRDTLDISEISSVTLAACAKSVLTNLGKSDSLTIGTEDFSDMGKIFSSARFDGDGIITEISCDTAEEKKVLADIVSTLSGKTDLCGLSGADADMVKDFYSQCAAEKLWYDSASGNIEVNFCKDETANAFAAFAQIKDKIDEFFERLDIYNFDATSHACVNAAEDEFKKKGLS